MSYTFDVANFDSYGFPFRTPEDIKQAELTGVPAFIRLVEFAEKPDECEIKVGCGVTSIAETQKYLVIEVLAALQTYVDLEIGRIVFEMMDRVILKDVLDVLNFYALGADKNHLLQLMQSIENGGARLHDITLRFIHHQSVCKANLELYLAQN